MNSVLGILGAGHLGQQIAHYALADHHFEQVVFFDDFTKASVVNNCKVLGTTNDVLECFTQKKITHLMVGIGYKHMEARAAFYDQFKNEIPFGTLIHSSCWVDPTAQIGAGVMVYPGSILDANVVIEHNVLLNVGCTIAHDTCIGAHCFLSPRVALAGFITVEEKVQLGINCTVIDNITIVNEAQVGAGAVVVKDITKKGIYVGIPAQLIAEK